MILDPICCQKTCVLKIVFSQCLQALQTCPRIREWRPPIKLIPVILFESESHIALDGMFVSESVGLISLARRLGEFDASFCFLL